MIRISKRASKGARAALLAIGLMTGTATLSTTVMAAPAAPKMNFTKPFAAVAGPLSKALEDLKKAPTFIAAQGKVTAATSALQQARGTAAIAQARSAREAAVAELRATMTAQISQLEGVFAAIGNQDDRLMAGQIATNLGSMALDPALQRRGVVAMIESGKVSPADLPKFQYYAGSLAYDVKDYAAARAGLQAAVSAGYHDNDADALLAEAYLSDNQVPQGLAVLKQAIAQRNSTPSKAPAGWYRRGLGAAYKANLLDQATDFAISLVKAYPTSDNWSGAITVVREIGKFPAQETLDLMRLMGRTNSYAEERDYVEYIQAADPRRLPGEVLKVIEAGVAAGKLRATDTFVSEARGIANMRIAADRASLVGLERDARSPTASAATVGGAADAFLSYGEAAKAESLFNLAMAKPGAEQDRLLTRLGIAQLDQGNYAGSQATFARVGGTRKYLAQLWSIYAGLKAAPAPVAAP